MFNGIFQFSKWFGAFACLGVILSAVYMLNMIQKVFFGNPNALTENAIVLSKGQKVVLSVIVILYGLKNQAIGS